MGKFKEMDIERQERERLLDECNCDQALELKQQVSDLEGEVAVLRSRLNAKKFCCEHVVKTRGWEHDPSCENWVLRKLH